MTIFHDNIVQPYLHMDCHCSSHIHSYLNYVHHKAVLHVREWDYGMSDFEHVAHHHM